MVLEAARPPLVAWTAEPEPGPGEVLVGVHACGVCRTDLHIVDGELPSRSCRWCSATRSSARSCAGPGERFAVGDRVGVPWLGWTCGECRYCRSGRENLCERARFTGYQIDGGYAEFAVADERYCFRCRPATGDRGRAAAVRRPDRLPGAAAWRGRRAPRPLRVRRLGAHRLPGRGPQGAGSTPSPPGDERRRRSPASSAPSGRRLTSLAGAARRGDHLRPGRRAGPGRAAAVAPGGTSSAPAST